MDDDDNNSINSSSMHNGGLERPGLEFCTEWYVVIC